MATINGLYIFVQDESADQGIESVSHAVENGIDLTDHVSRKPFQLTIKGEIVGPNANSIRGQLVEMMYAGALVTYIGRNYCANVQIQSFKTGHPHTIKGGLSFDMSLKEVRIAQSAYQEVTDAGKTPIKPVTKAGTQQVESAGGGSEKVYHNVKSGETVYYIGEKLYKTFGSSLAFIQQNNPEAPRKKGDWKTLPVGTKLHVYSKKVG